MAVVVGKQFLNRKRSPRIANRKWLFYDKRYAPCDKLAQGFTLIEMLVVVAIMGIVMVLGSNIFISVIRSGNKTQIINQVREEGTRVTELLSRSIQNASSLYYPTTTTACAPYIIVQNKAPQQVSGSSVSYSNAVGQKKYTRFSIVTFAASGGTAQTNGYIGLDANDDPTQIDSGGNGTILKTGTSTVPTAITNNTGSTGVDLDVTAAPANCFKVKKDTASGVTIITSTLTFKQSRTAPSSATRLDFKASNLFQSTYTIR